MRFTVPAIFIITMLTTLSVWLVEPLLTYNVGTSRDMSVEVTAEPYRESSTLKYTWSGDIYRACPIVIDRQIITSERVVIELTSSPLLPALPVEDLGLRSYPLEVETPKGLPEGETVYQATERPRCTWLQRLFPPRVPYPPVSFTVTH